MTSEQSDRAKENLRRAREETEKASATLRAPRGSTLVVDYDMAAAALRETATNLQMLLALTDAEWLSSGVMQSRAGVLASIRDVVSEVATALAAASGAHDGDH